MSTITSSELSKEIARNVVRLLLPKIRTMLREEVESLKEELIVENQGVNIVNDIPKKQVRKISDLRSLYPKNPGEAYESVKLSKAEITDREMIDESTLNIAGKMTVEDIEQRAKQGEYLDPSAADYSKYI